MSKIVIFSLPSYGHLYPIIPVIKELVSHNNQVIIYSTDEYRNILEATGATYISYPKYKVNPLIITTNPMKFGVELFSIAEANMPEFLDFLEKEKPDVILHDALAVWGKISASMLKYPAISYSVTMAFSRKVLLSFPRASLSLMYLLGIQAPSTAKAYKKFLSLQQKYHLKTKSIHDLLINKEDLNIMFTSRYFHPCEKTFDDSFKFVGPSIYSRNDAKTTIDVTSLKTDKKIIYIALGTIFNYDIGFYKKCVEAFGNTQYQVIMSLGHRFHISDFPPFPENFIVGNHMPQLAILPKASLFISHGGMGSVNESLYYGVPLLIIPQMQEQKFNAYRVQQLKAGLYLRKRYVSVKRLRSMAEKILTDPKFYSQAKKISESFKEAGGYKKAVEYIEKFTQNPLIS